MEILFYPKSNHNWDHVFLKLENEIILISIRRSLNSSFKHQQRKNALGQEKNAKLSDKKCPGPGHCTIFFCTGEILFERMLYLSQSPISLNKITSGKNMIEVKPEFRANFILTLFCFPHFFFFNHILSWLAFCQSLIGSFVNSIIFFQSQTKKFSISMLFLQ